MFVTDAQRLLSQRSNAGFHTVTSLTWGVCFTMQSCVTSSLPDRTRPRRVVVKDPTVSTLLIPEYKLLSLTYTALATAQPSYLHSLILSVQPLRATRSSSVVTLSRLPTSLKITSRSFPDA